MNQSLRNRIIQFPPFAIAVFIIGTALFGYFVYEQVYRRMLTGDNSQSQNSQVIELTQETFDNTISEGLVLVEFGAPWCGACRRQAPITEQLAATIGERALITKLNVDNYGNIASRFQIQSIPAIIIFKDGNPVSKFVGLTQKEVLENAISELL